jgi:hypothetical protein
MTRTRSEARCYPIHWIQIETGRRQVYLAICGRTKEPIRLSTAPIYLLVVNNLYASDTQCEEGQRCCAIGCPLNRTTPATLAAAFGLKRVPKWMTAIKPLPVSTELCTQIDRLCAQHADQGVIVADP